MQFMFAKPVLLLDEPPKTLQCGPLLYSSDKAWLVNDPNLRSIDPAKAKKSKFNLATWAVKANIETRGYSRIVVVGDADFCTNTLLTSTSRDFVVNAVRWLANRESAIAIGPKDIGNFQLQMTERAFSTWSLLVFGGLPLISLFIGCVVWWRRRL